MFGIVRLEHAVIRSKHEVVVIPVRDVERLRGEVFMRGRERDARSTGRARTLLDVA